MARRVFYSFYYKPDNWRASKVRNIGAIEGNKPATDNDWETVTSKGDAAIEKWIKDQMAGRSCAVVLIGQSTAGRKWIEYEIVESWKKGWGFSEFMSITSLIVQANSPPKGLTRSPVSK